MGSRAKASSSFGTRVVCSVWSVVLGRGSTGPESGLSGPPAAKTIKSVNSQEVNVLCRLDIYAHIAFLSYSKTLKIYLREKLSKSSSSSPWSCGIITLSVMAGGSSNMPPPSSLLRSLSTGIKALNLTSFYHHINILSVKFGRTYPEFHHHYCPGCFPQSHHSQGLLIYLGDGQDQVQAPKAGWRQKNRE